MNLRNLAIWGVIGLVLLVAIQAVRLRDRARVTPHLP